MIHSTASLKAEAVQRTGLNDFGNPWFEAPVGMWARDLNWSQLNDRGRAFLARLAVTNLCRRLEVIDWLNRHPAIDDVAVPPIVYVSGMERSGTTLLHNLLALDPRGRALLRWELMHPVPAPTTETYRSDPRIADVQRAADQLRGTPLERMHWVNADDPEECVWGAFDCTGLLGRAGAAVMPNWSAWIDSADLMPSYREYRRLIRLLIWRNPLPEGGHLVLKCPQHSRDLLTLAQAFPEARFVLTHRDPFRTSVSACALIAGIDAPFAADSEAFAWGGDWVRTTVASMERSAVGMTAFAGASHPRADVAYPQLITDPAGTVRAIYAALGLDWPEGFDARIGAFLAAQASGKRARPPAELPTFGLEHASYLARQAMAAYCRRFGIAPEVTRQTGA
ncbi:MAG: sulfotransferase family protein [Micropepsaceae bacterium]